MLKIVKVFVICFLAFITSGMPAIAQVQDKFSPVIKDIEQHVADVNGILADLKKISSTDQAKAYQSNLTGKIEAFLAHVKKVDTVHGPELEKAAAVGGTISPNVVLAGKYRDELNADTYPKLTVELARVEALLPALKPTFDRIRKMHQQ
jgi:hypothetical protein